jgi:hypothetical protein
MILYIFVTETVLIENKSGGHIGDHTPVTVPGVPIV